MNPDLLSLTKTPGKFLTMLRDMDIKLSKKHMLHGIIKTETNPRIKKRLEKEKKSSNG